jgi:hypothetical protein
MAIRVISSGYLLSLGSQRFANLYENVKYFIEKN